MLEILSIYLVVGVVFSLFTWATVADMYTGPISAFLIMPIIWPYQLYLQLKYKGVL